MYQRRILHHGPDPSSAATQLQNRAITGCWFELHRRGGCGAGEIVLRDEFPVRQAIDIGDWISCEAAPGERWYLGRVEERHAESPAQMRLRLEGMAIELAEVFPGGFASDADGAPPHRFAATDLFTHDPDRWLETFDSVASAESLVRLLIERYVEPVTQIQYDADLIEEPRYPAPVGSLKFRGEESVAAILKELGLRSQAAWGVDAQGRFFFLRERPQVLTVWREGRDLVSLSETRDRELLFNRVLLTGDYVYDRLDGTEDIARRSFRWRGNYTQPESRALYGDRRIRLWVPWLRTEVDSLTFVREFFRTYARPTSRFLIETRPLESLPLPWTGRVRLEDRVGDELFTGAIETVRVNFDHVPQFRLELGPEDPRDLWPEPPHDERWELPEGRRPGGPVSLTDRPSLTFSGYTSFGGPESGSDSPSESASEGSIDPSIEPSSAETSWHSGESNPTGSESPSEGSSFDLSSLAESQETSAGSDGESLSDSTGSWGDSSGVSSMAGSSLSPSSPGGFSTASEDDSSNPDSSIDVSEEDSSAAASSEADSSDGKSSADLSLDSSIAQSMTSYGWSSADSHGGSLPSSQPSWETHSEPEPWSEVSSLDSSREEWGGSEPSLWDSEVSHYESE